MDIDTITSEIVDARSQINPYDGAGTGARWILVFTALLFIIKKIKEIEATKK